MQIGYAAIPGFTTAQKNSCRLLTSRAIRHGELKRGACICCGRANAQGHHVDYRAPLAILWLCCACHNAWHRMDFWARAGVVHRIDGPLRLCKRYARLMQRRPKRRVTERWLTDVLHLSHLIAASNRTARYAALAVAS